MTVEQHEVPGGPPAPEPWYRRGPVSLLARWVPTVLGLGLLVVSLVIVGDVLRRFELRDILAAVASTGWGSIVLSLLFTALSFTAITGYELFAVRFSGKRPGLATTALAAYTAQSIAHTTGFAVAIATSLRYRIYAPRGLDLLDVMKVQAFFAFTFVLGLITLCGIVLVAEPNYPARLVPLPLVAWQAIGAVSILAVLAYMAWSARTRHPFMVRGQAIMPPRPGVTLCQIGLAFVDLGAGAAALYVLLPPGLDVAYLPLLGMFLAAVILGAVSHVPGALGVLEGAMLLQLAPGPALEPAVLGALLLYRVTYYLVPFALGCLLYGWHEYDRLRTFLERAPGRGLGWLRHAVPTAAAGLAFVILVVLLLDR